MGMAARCCRDGFLHAFFPCPNLSPSSMQGVISDGGCLGDQQFCSGRVPREVQNAPGEPDALRGAGPCTDPGFALPQCPVLSTGAPFLAHVLHRGEKRKANIIQEEKPALTKAAWFLFCSSRHANPTQGKAPKWVPIAREGTATISHESGSPPALPVGLRGIPHPGVHI